MSVSLPQRLAKHTYFVLNSELYYVVDVTDEQYLVENCKTLNLLWFEAEIVDYVAKEVTCLKQQ